MKTIYTEISPVAERINKDSISNGISRLFFDERKKSRMQRISANWVDQVRRSTWEPFVTKELMKF